MKWNAHWKWKSFMIKILKTYSCVAHASLFFFFAFYIWLWLVIGNLIFRWNVFILVMSYDFGKMIKYIAKRRHGIRRWKKKEKKKKKLSYQWYKEPCTTHVNAKWHLSFVVLSLLAINIFSFWKDNILMRVASSLKTSSSSSSLRNRKFAKSN